ncbi:MAG: hypothetical protein WDM77_05095 [Steroidobacteraceae bacterium]
MIPLLKHAAIFSALIICGCAATAAMSQDSAAAPAGQDAGEAGPYHFDCDAPLGEMRAMSVHVPQGAFRVTGFFQILDIDRKGEYPPQVNIVLVESNKTERIALVSIVHDALIGLSLSKSRYVTYFARIARSAGRIPFTLTFDSQGKVNASVEDVPSPTVHASSAIAQLTLGCSSTHANLTKVSVVPLK